MQSFLWLLLLLLFTAAAQQSPSASNLFFGPLANFSLGIVLGITPGEVVGTDSATTVSGLGAFPWMRSRWMIPG